MLSSLSVDALSADSLAVVSPDLVEEYVSVTPVSRSSCVKRLYLHIRARL